MTSIDRFRRTVGQLTRQAGLAKSEGNSNLELTDILSSKAGTAKTNTARIQQSVKQKISGLNLNSNVDQERAISIFFEAVLGEEFGFELLKDDKTYEMISDLQKKIEATPAIKKKYLDLLLWIQKNE